MPVFPQGVRTCRTRGWAGRTETSPTEKLFMIPGKAPTKRAQIDRVLESAVVLSWNDLVKGSHPGTIDIEYGTAPEPSLQYLKIWLSTARGTWDLICEYWISSGSSPVPAAGLTFSNGYYSSDLKQMLEHLMRHQVSIPDLLSGKSGVSLMRIQPPTKDIRLQAGSCMKEACQRLGLVCPSIPESAA
jgi:hypothetical protein